MNLNKSDIAIVSIATVALWWVAYLIFCGMEMIHIINTIGCTEVSAGALMLTPSFTIANLRDDRRYSESDRLRNYVGLHTPIYRVLNHAQKFILAKGLSRDFDMHTNRGQQKWIYREGVLNISLNRGYSEVTIGARRIFAVSDWTRMIYHIDASGVWHETEYTQDYDMTDVIAQVTEALEVIAEHYNADKYDAIDATKAEQEWYCYGADNLGVVNDRWQRATVSLWHIKDSNKSVEWTKYWGRETPTGAREYKTTTGSHPTAYRVAIGDKAYWIPHSICSRTTAIHGGRYVRHDGADRFLGFQMHLQQLDLPVWWLEKTIGTDWIDKVDPIGRSEFFKAFVPKRRYYRR